MRKNTAGNPITSGLAPETYGPPPTPIPCVTLLLTEGVTRPLDEKVKAFAQKHTNKLTCFDCRDYALPGISDRYRPLLSPVIMAAVLQRISKNIEVITDHSLDIRRYYRKGEYS